MELGQVAAWVDTAAKNRIAAENAAEKAATEKLVASGELSVGMVVERRGGDKPEWREGYITSLWPLKVTCTQSPSAESFEWGGVRPVSEERQDEMQRLEARKAGRERNAAENVAEKAATQKLVASGKLSVGMVVERRDGGNEWREGYITSLRPLKVTCTQSPSDHGLVWDGVRPARHEKLKLEPALEPAPEPELRSDCEAATGTAGSSSEGKMHRGEMEKSDTTEECTWIGHNRTETSPVRRELAELRALCALAIGPEQPESCHMVTAQSDPRYLSLSLGEGITDKRVEDFAASASSPRSPHLEELCSILQISTSDRESFETLPDAGDQETAPAEQEWNSMQQPQLPKQPIAAAQQLELEEVARELVWLRETEEDVLTMEAHLQSAQLELARRQCIVGSQAMDAATRLCAASSFQASKSQVGEKQAMLSSGSNLSNLQIPEAVPPAAD
jgi:hypothetical protein